MRADLQSRKKATVAAITPPSRGLLQRKCACGGAPSAEGECAECRRNRLLSQRKLERGMSPNAPNASSLRTTPEGALLQSSWGHSLERVRVNSDPLSSRQLGPEEGEREHFSAEGVLMTLAGSGTCQNGGGESVCDPATGVYKIIANNNTCCTKECTQAHEQTHVNDVTGWGCCKALAQALKKPGADRNALVTKYNDWMAKAIPLTECNAYTNDVRCADLLAKAKGCDTDEGKKSDCCKDIADYRATYGALATSNCAAAPKKAPPCPAF